jgi:hypothetical protein
MASMTLRKRKLLGVMATVAFLAIYILVAMVIGGEYATGAGKAVELIFFLAAGIAWVPGVMAIIRWMSKTDIPR